MTEILAELKEARRPVPPLVHQARLYYDGGSRGNLGSSGSGSVILERETQDHPWTIVWWDVHLFPGPQTNNYAEHTGLEQGLAEAARRYSADAHIIDVIGDSMLITNQMNGTARINQPNFLPIVSKSRDVLRLLYYVRFQHALQTGNKMADTLASIAMDHAATPAASTLLNDHLPNDTHHPLTITSHPTPLLDLLRPDARPPIAIASKRPASLHTPSPKHPRVHT